MYVEITWCARWVVKIDGADGKLSSRDKCFSYFIRYIICWWKLQTTVYLLIQVSVWFTTGQQHFKSCIFIWPLNICMSTFTKLLITFKFKVLHQYQLLFCIRHKCLSSRHIAGGFAAPLFYLRGCCGLHYVCVESTFLHSYTLCGLSYVCFIILWLKKVLCRFDCWSFRLALPQLNKQRLQLMHST